MREGPEKRVTINLDNEPETVGKVGAMHSQ